MKPILFLPYGISFCSYCYFFKINFFNFLVKDIFVCSHKHTVCMSDLSKCCALIDMGVKDLWTILEPVKQHKHLSELKGQVIAVDLSIWIVESKTLQLKGVTKPHLRWYKCLRLT